MTERKPAADGHLEDEMIRAAREANPAAEIKLPLWGHNKVDCREDLMLLIALGIKAAERAERAVILKARVDLFSDRVGDFEIRRELKASLRARSPKRAFKGRIECEVPTLELLIDDRTNFPAPGIFGKFAPHVTNLLRETDPDGPMPFGRDAKARANMRADEIQATANARAGEDVESGFKPIVEAVRDLDRLVPGVIRGQRAVVSLLRPFRGEVIVQLDHGDAARDGFRAVDLDLIVILSVDGKSREEENKQDKTPSPWLAKREGIADKTHWARILH